MPPAGSLRVGRFHADYVVPAAHPEAEGVRGRLDQAARGALVRGLRRTLAPLLDTSDESVWLIRRLHVELEVEAEWDDDLVARAWASQIARALGRALAEGRSGSDAVPVAPGDAVVHFPDRAAYLARFLADLAAGDAWGKWYYAAFDGLRPLSVSGALRTAACDDVATGLRALLALPAAERRRVVERLTPHDARRLMDALPAGERGGDPSQGWDELRRAWEALPPHAPPAHAETRAALELYLRACAGAPALAGPLLGARSRALVRLARRLAEGGPADAARLVRALERDDPAALYAAARDDAEALLPLREAPSGWVEGARTVLSPARAPERPAAAGTTTVVRSTPFGGLFLLLPLLDRLPLDDATRGWPPAGDTPAPAALRLLVAAKALGSSRSARVFWDPVARDALGVEPSLAPAVVRRWIARLPADALPRLLARLAQPGGSAEGETAALLGARLPGAPAAVLVDASSGVWRWAGGYARRRPDAAVDRAAEWMDAAGWAPARILADPEFTGALRTRRAGTGVHPPDGDEAAHLAAGDPRRGAVLARRGRLADDLAWLAALALGLPRAADLALSVAAQGVLRAFAARLPGFHASGLPYLCANFLDVAATVEVEPERWVVRLGRPPLQFVLALSGAARGEHRPGWMPGVTLALCQEGE